MNITKLSKLLIIAVVWAGSVVIHQAQAENFYFTFRNGQTYAGEFTAISNGVLTFVNRADGMAQKARSKDIKQMIAASTLSETDKKAMDKSIRNPVKKAKRKKKTPDKKKKSVVTEKPEYGKHVGTYTIMDLKKNSHDLDGKIIKLKVHERGDIEQISKEEYEVSLWSFTFGKRGGRKEIECLYRVVFEKEALPTFERINMNRDYGMAIKAHYIFGIVKTDASIWGTTIIPIGRRLKKLPGNKVKYTW